MKNNTLTGRTIANYHIQRLIGRGGMADVYHGQDIKLHRQVAVKVFDVRKRSNVSQVNRFLQEARMMANWRHENIIQVYSAGDETGLFYYVMEYIDGYDLASILSVYAEKDELMPIEDVLRIGDAIASALDYAHTQGVIHRDVKPANVMIANRDGRVALGDFGLALNLSEKSQGEVFGSPHYIAPEQARRSSDAVPQSDLYSLGVILYEMITGATPFNDPSPAALALQHITEPPPPPRSINPGISIAVENVLLKALEKSPSERYQSGRALMDALRYATNNSQPIPVIGSSLPPIPVNAPTIRRSDESLRSFTRRRDVITELEKKTTVVGGKNLEKPVKSNRSSRPVLITIILLMLFTGAGFAFQENLLPIFMTADTPTPTAVFKPTLTFTPVPSRTSTTSPTASPTTEPTVTIVPSATFTASATHAEILPTETSIPSVTLPSTIAPVLPTTLPSGHLMTAFYNDSSFYILDRGKASRSVSGFVFERINKENFVDARFEGWEWEQFFSVIQPNRCVKILVKDSNIPDLLPAECSFRVVATLTLEQTSEKIFWVSKEDGLSFRIIWLENEVARCTFENGFCDFYVP